MWCCLLAGSLAAYGGATERSGVELRTVELLACWLNPDVVLRCIASLADGATGKAARPQVSGEGFLG